MKKSSFFLCILFASHSAFPVGIGSSNWGGDYSSGGDPFGAVILSLISIFFLLTAWLKGKASIKTIYIPTAIGGFILYLILDKFTFGAFIFYIVFGFFLGQIIRLLFWRLFEPTDEPVDKAICDVSLVVNNDEPKKTENPIKIKKYNNIEDVFGGEGLERLRKKVDSFPDLPGYLVISNNSGQKYIIICGDNIKSSFLSFLSNFNYILNSCDDLQNIKFLTIYWDQSYIMELRFGVELAGLSAIDAARKKAAMLNKQLANCAFIWPNTIDNFTMPTKF